MRQDKIICFDLDSSHWVGFIRWIFRPRQHELKTNLRGLLGNANTVIIKLFKYY